VNRVRGWRFDFTIDASRWRPPFPGIGDDFARAWILDVGSFFGKWHWPDLSILVKGPYLRSEKPGAGPIEGIVIDCRMMIHSE
jgi:hypothetical protein